jgi:isopentenyl diphosphate isomerase/L-lactate dehydrogenase-like FMN-dependent dehydrogenase
MNRTSARIANRRHLLRFLCASPLISAAVRTALADEILKLPAAIPDPIPWAFVGSRELIQTPEEALSVFDFELVAQKNVPPAHFGRVATGSDDDQTLRANREDFSRVRLRPRRLRGVSAVDSSIKLFGATWDSPVFICPTGSANSLHPDGYIGVSKAAEAGKHLQLTPGAISTSIEDVIAARGGTPVWCQVYPGAALDALRPVIAKAERAGSPVLVVTVDGGALPNFDTYVRMRRLDNRSCISCHKPRDGEQTVSDPLGQPHGAEIFPSVDWDFIRRLRDHTKMKLTLKGILAPEDAALCVKHGMDGIIVSNHGGRVGDFGTSSIRALPEVIAAVGGKIPVLVDGGFRRGMDVIKALAMGATAVGVGRPYLWGLGAFGQRGVERVLEILRAETRTAMAEVGAATVRDLVPQMVV